MKSMWVISGWINIIKASHVYVTGSLRRGSWRYCSQVFDGLLADVTDIVALDTCPLLSTIFVSKS